jgi:hypothetical protein
MATTMSDQHTLADIAPPCPLTLLLCLLRQAATIDTDDTGDAWLEGHGMLIQTRTRNGGTAWEVTPVGMAIAERAAEQLMQHQHMSAVIGKCRKNEELDRLLAAAKPHVITPDEHEAQRQSWARGNSFD